MCREWKMPDREEITAVSKKDFTIKTGEKSLVIRGASDSGEKESGWTRVHVLRGYPLEAGMSLGEN